MTPLEDEYLARMRAEVGANKPLGVMNAIHLLDEIKRLRIELIDWQDSSEAFRADVVRLAMVLKEAVDYADVAAQAEGMPPGKQAVRLTATAVGEDPTATMVFDVKAAREILASVSNSQICNQSNSPR